MTQREKDGTPAKEKVLFIIGKLATVLQIVISVVFTETGGVDSGQIFDFVRSGSGCFNYSFLAADEAENKTDPFLDWLYPGAAGFSGNGICGSENL